MIRRLAPLVLAALALAPRAADALLSVDVFYGLTRPPSASFSAAVAGAQNNPDLIASSLQIAGGDVLLHLGTLELGAIVDTSFKSGSASQTAVGALGGVGFDLLKTLRVEALGEVGGQRYGDFTKNPSILTASSKSEWLAYVGLRPGVAYRFDVGPAGFLVGLWGFVRWDLTTSTVPVTVASASGTQPGSVKLGGATIGAVARVGLDF
ncbi:MAG TPA: hypothetical protein VIV57_08630 [Anaeromyxobacter sp.]